MPLSTHSASAHAQELVDMKFAQTEVETRGGRILRRCIGMEWVARVGAAHACRERHEGRLPMLSF